MDLFEFHEEHWLQSWNWSSIGMAIVSLEGKILDINKSFADKLQYTTTELLRKHVDDITTESDRGTGMAELNRVIAGELPYYSQTKRYDTKFGGQIEAYVRSLPIRREKQLHHFLSLVIFKVNGSKGMAEMEQTKSELDSLRRDHQRLVEAIVNGSMNQERNIIVNPTDINGDGNQVAGRDLNSDKTIRFLIGGLVATAVAVAWLFYYVATASTGDTPETPRIEQVEK